MNGEDGRLRPAGQAGQSLYGVRDSSQHVDARRFGEKVRRFLRCHPEATRQSLSLRAGLSDPYVGKLLNGFAEEISATSANKLLRAMRGIRAEALR